MQNGNFLPNDRLHKNSYAPKTSGMQAKLLGYIVGTAPCMHQFNESLAKLWRVRRSVFAYLGLLRFEP